VEGQVALVGEAHGPGDLGDGEHEIIWVKSGVPSEAGLRRADWTTVEML
jgi:hypothetical protein